MMRWNDGYSLSTTKIHLQRRERDDEQGGTTCNAGGRVAGPKGVEVGLIISHAGRTDEQKRRSSGEVKSD